jgi:hypothetical protein
MGLALPTHASMPLKYWDKSFLAVVYLINRTPTKLLAYDTSIHKLLEAPLIILDFWFLGVPASQSFIHIILTSYNSVSSVVSSLGIAACTRASNA